MPHISIIIPVYNVERHLARCLDSLLNQSYSDFELLLVDDGSPDGSGAICDAYAARDARIRVIHQPNGGVGSARNAALAIAQGAFIAFVDPDDYVGEDYLLHMVQAQQLNDADMVITRSITLLENGKPQSRVIPLRGSRFIASGQLLDAVTMLINDHRIFALWNKLFRARILDGITYRTDVAMAGDVIMVAMILGKTQSIQLTDAADYYYIRYAGGSITSSSSPKKYLERIKVDHILHDIFEQYGWLTPNMRRALSDINRSHIQNAINVARRSEWPYRDKLRYIHDVINAPEFREYIKQAYLRGERGNIALMYHDQALMLLIKSSYYSWRKYHDDRLLTSLLKPVHLLKRFIVRRAK